MATESPRSDRGHTWARAWRRVLYSARTSVILTVALVPPLIDQIFRLFGDVPPWVLGGALVLAMLVLFAFFARQEIRYRAADEPADSSMVRIHDTSWITTLVCPVTLSVPLRDRPEAVQSLVQNLGHVRRVRMVFSDRSDPEPSKDAFRAWLAGRLGREVEVDSLAHRPQAYQLSTDDVTALAAELSAYPNDGLVVDITGGTKVMTLALHQAATRAGLPVTYVVQRDDARWGGLTVVSDPEHVLTPSVHAAQAR